MNKNTAGNAVEIPMALYKASPAAYPVPPSVSQSASALGRRVSSPTNYAPNSAEVLRPTNVR